MAFVNAFQSGQQFANVQAQQAQNIKAGKQNIFIKQQQNKRAEKSQAAKAVQQAIDNSARQTQAERLGEEAEREKAELNRVNQRRGLNNTVNFIQAGLKSGAPIEEILARAQQPLAALGVTPEQFGPLAKQIAADPSVLDQFKSALTQGNRSRKAVGRPVAVRVDGKTALLQTFSDGSSEVVDDVSPLAEELGQGRLDVQRQRIAPKAAGELAGAKAEAKEIGKTRGEIAATQLTRSKRQTLAAKRAVASRKQRAELVDKSIDEAISDAGFFTTGLIGSALSNIGGTDARDLAATLDTVRANVGFNELQRLRDNSPTGGALGQVSERENILLQSVLGSIEQAQSEGQFKQRLGDLKEQIRLSQERVAEAFEDDFGVPYAGPNTAIPSELAGQPSLQTMSDEELDAAIAAAGG